MRGTRPPPGRSPDKQDAMATAPIPAVQLQAHVSGAPDRGMP